MDRGVIATATELFEARHFPGVIAICSDALEDEPECVPLLLMRARARMVLRHDLDAQGDLRDVIRLDPKCALAYRLLGELAMRRDKGEPAAIFFREALALAPGDPESAAWLQIAERSIRPAAVAKKLPAPATAAGRVPAPRAPESRRPGGEPSSPDLERQPRFARGTNTPDPAHLEERPTRPLARGSDRPGPAWAKSSGVPASSAAAAPAPAASRTPTPVAEPLPPPPSTPANHARAFVVAAPAPNHAGAFLVSPAREVTEDLPEVIPLLRPKEPGHWEQGTLRGRPESSTPPAKQAPRLAGRPQRRGAIPELPGFGEYLVATGILTPERLRAAQAYQRSMKVQLSTAIVTLGLATPQRIEWASVAHQSQVSRGG